MLLLMASRYWRIYYPPIPVVVVVGLQQQSTVFPLVEGPMNSRSVGAVWWWVLCGGGWRKDRDYYDWWFNLINAGTIKTCSIGFISYQFIFKTTMSLLKLVLYLVFFYSCYSMRLTRSVVSIKPRKLCMKSDRIFKSSIQNRLSTPRIISSFIPKFAFNPAIVGGLLSGGLHAITGPDHLAAILPSSVGQRWWKGVRIGAIWGLGHGLSATLLGMAAYFLKGKMSSKFVFLQSLSNLAESIVGLSLVTIGIFGMKEAFSVDVVDGSGHDDVDGNPEWPQKKKENRSSTTIFVNGMLHGFSWDGTPSLAPALAMTSWKSVLSFLFSYCLGTMLTMSMTAGIVGEGSVRLGEAVNNPNLPRTLSLFSSVLAISIGIFWIVQAFL